MIWGAIELDPVLVGSLLALLAGFLICACPNLLCYLAAGYLILSALVGFYSGAQDVALVSLAAGILIAVFPKLIPYFLAAYLLALGVLGLLAFGISAGPVLALLAALLLFALPDLIAYTIGAYFVLAGLLGLAGKFLE